MGLSSKISTESLIELARDIITSLNIDDIYICTVYKIDHERSIKINIEVNRDRLTKRDYNEFDKIINIIIKKMNMFKFRLYTKNKGIYSASIILTYRKNKFKGLTI